MTRTRQRLLVGAFLLAFSCGLARLAWSHLPSLPDLLSGDSAIRSLPPLDPVRRTVPPVRQGGEWTVVPGMEALPVPAESVEAAIAIYRRLVDLWRLTGDRAGRARGLAFLAGLEGSVGRIADSERHYGEARELLEGHSRRSEDLAWLHNNQGLTRLNRRAHAAALESFRAALGAFPEQPDSLVEERALVEQNLATSYFALGDVEAAEGAYLAALEHLETTRPSPRLEATLRQNLAGLYTRMGDFVAAEKELGRALEVAPPADRLLIFSILNNLGDTLRAQRRHREAEGRFREAATGFTGALDGRRLVVLNRLLNFWEAGDLEAAETLLGEARELVRDSGASNTAAMTLDLTAGRLAVAHGQYELADDLLGKVETSLRERAPGEARFLAEVLAERALVADRLGERSRALAIGREAFALELAQLDQILAFGSELQRLEYQRQARPYDHLANLGDPGLLAEAVLTTKGAVLDSLLVERRAARAAGDGPGRALLERIQALRHDLLSARAQGEDESATDERLAELKRQETALAQSVGKAVKAERAAVRLEQVRAALAPDEALVELIEYRAIAGGGRSSRALGALVIAHRGAIRWLPLGPAEPVERALDTLLQSVASGARGSLRPPWREAQAPRGALEALSDTLWRPVAAVLPAGTRRITFAPDGALHFVPWAALLATPDRFVVEQFDISTVSTGRDLLVPRGAPKGATILVLADGRGDLPFAREEAQTVAQAAIRHGWSSTLLVGDAATEPALRQRKGPTVVHLATHGSVFDGFETDAIARRLSRQAMYRGHLMLGGTNDTLRAWREGRVVPVERDGILTAEEASDLDLDDTWLTVLSACETGRGESRGGEGILGLRRGFSLAGSRQLLFTLWPVDDRATAAFMADFYAALFTREDASAAFAETQRRHLRRWWQSDGPVLAVLQAGGFVLGK